MIKNHDGRKVVKHTTKYYNKRYRDRDGKEDDDGLYDANEDFILIKTMKLR